MNSTRLILPALLLAACNARAAGGHFDVDDATMLDPGQCQVEAWAVSARRPGASLLHVGPACHGAGVEWGFNADRFRADGVTTDIVGAQAKWVLDPAATRLGIGAVAIAGARSRGGPHGTLATAYLPVTLWLGDERTLPVHVNVGRDHDPAAGTFRRWGIAADWSFGERWLLTVERRSILGQALTRAGVRFFLAPGASVDVSAARDGAARFVAAGFNWEWER